MFQDCLVSPPTMLRTEGDTHCIQKYRLSIVTGNCYWQTLSRLIGMFVWRKILDQYILCELNKLSVN